jgi:hypothetical protein
MRADEWRAAIFGDLTDERAAKALEKMWRVFKRHAEAAHGTGRQSAEERNGDEQRAARAGDKGTPRTEALGHEVRRGIENTIRDAEHGDKGGRGARHAVADKEDGDGSRLHGTRGRAGMERATGISLRVLRRACCLHTHVCVLLAMLSLRVAGR